MSYIANYYKCPKKTIIEYLLPCYFWRTLSEFLYDA